MKQIYVIYNLKQGREEGFLFYTDSAFEAQERLMNMIEETNGTSDEEQQISIFDFGMSIEEANVNEAITSFEEARKYLGGTTNGDFTISKKVFSQNCLNLNDVAGLVNDLNPVHVKRLIALNKLFTIAQAWNKEEEFEPDFSNVSQNKYFPWFEYSRCAAGFVCVDVTNAALVAGAVYGSHICFKTRERAMQFGEQFIDLWNEVLL